MTETAGAIRHPGPVSEERVRALPCRVQRTELALKTGASVHDAVARAVDALGADGAFVRLDGVLIEPLRYAIPAPSPDLDHAVWYSETHAPAGVATTMAAGVFLGRRNGGPSTHCHGLWRMRDSDVRMGHLHTPEAVVAERAHAPTWIVSGAVLDGAADLETNFNLFAAQPSTRPSHEAGARGLLCTIRPNVDLVPAIEALCVQHAFDRARLHGLGSFVGGTPQGGAILQRGPTTASAVTEALILDGRVVGGRSIVNAAVVGMDGRFSTGFLVGPTRTAVAFELLIEEI